MEYEIPLEPIASQQQKIDLNGLFYTMLVEWNTRWEVWKMSITDQDDNRLVSGVPMVIGVDLLDPYNLGIGQMWMIDLETTTADAGFTDLGTRVKLLYIEP